MCPYYIGKIRKFAFNFYALIFVRTVIISKVFEISGSKGLYGPAAI